MIFTGKRILLGVTGGIAAYKAAEVARRLMGFGARVKVVMTRSAQEFVGPMTFAALTGESVGTGLWGGGSDPLEHISLGQEVDAPPGYFEALPGRLRPRGAGGVCPRSRAGSR